MRERNATVPQERRIVYRIGINLGDVIVDGDDVYGDGVNVAARLEALAEPGGICVRRNVRDEVRDKLDIRFEDLGEIQVKNIARPIRCFAVRLDDGSERAPGATTGPGLPAKRPDRPAGAVRPFDNRVVDPEPDGAGEGLAKPTAAAPSLSVAVLPFVNLTADPADDPFVDGVTDDLITDLSRISGAFVISRNTTFTYKSRAVDIRQVARELAVQHVLKGSVRRAGENIRISTQLIDAETGAHAWADRFDIPRIDAYKLQDDVVGRIARALNMELKEAMSRRAARGRPQDLEAADLATQGWVILFNKPQSPDTNAQARPVLERAVALDPTNAEAWTGLAYLHARAGQYGWSDSRRESLRLAVEAGERAAVLDPKSADAHYVLGFAVHVANQTERARPLFERCLELNPNFAPAYFWLGWIEIYEGRNEDALRLVEKAFRLSPRDGLSAVWRSATSMAYLLLGDDEAAIREARRGIAENPRHPHNHQLLAASLAHLGDLENARAAIERSVALGPTQGTIAAIVANGRPSPELYAQRFARYLDGLRQAGMPEAS